MYCNSVMQSLAHFGLWDCIGLLKYSRGPTPASILPQSIRKYKATAAWASHPSKVDIYVKQPPSQSVSKFALIIMIINKVISWCYQSWSHHEILDDSGSGKVNLQTLVADLTMSGPGVHWPLISQVVSRVTLQQQNIVMSCFRATINNISAPYLINTNEFN